MPISRGSLAGARSSVDVVALPRTVIDATVTAAVRNLFKYSTVGFTGLKRALALAQSLRDNARIVIARDALIEYENVVADEESPGTWGIAFDELVAAKSKHIPMAPELVARLVSDLEARLGRLMHPKAPGVIPDPF